MLYQELVDKVLEVLIGLANEKHRKKTDAILKCLQRGKEPVRGERRSGQQMTICFLWPSLRIVRKSNVPSCRGYRQVR